MIEFIPRVSNSARGKYHVYSIDGRGGPLYLRALLKLSIMLISRLFSCAAIICLVLVTACDSEEEPSVKCTYNEEVNIGYYKEYKLGTGGIDVCQYAKAYTTEYINRDHNFPNQEGGYIFNIQGQVTKNQGGCPEFFVRFVSDEPIKTGKKYEALGYMKDGACHTANTIASIKFSKIDFVNQSVSGTFSVGNSEAMRNGLDAISNGEFHNVPLSNKPYH
jgi:hypothetical protein